jgi:RNA polymerase sigma-70 factor (ECF subfamily)
VPRDAEGRRDRELLRQLAEGRQEALAELYDRHAASLFRHAVALARHRTDAEDLVHTVFVRIAGLGPDLLGVRAPAGYLHRMLHTTWIDNRRRMTTAERIAAGTVPDSTEAPAHDTVMDVMRALDALPLEQRETVLLRAVEGFSFREIGRMTGVSLFTAAARYRLAVGKLRAALGPAAKGMP